MARTWTQVKSEKRALGRTDSVRVVQLKGEMLEEHEAARAAKVQEAHGEQDEKQAGQEHPRHLPGV